MRMWRTIRVGMALCAALGVGSGISSAQQNPAPERVLLDRVIAVVNNRAILASDLDREMRLSVLEPAEGAEDKPDPKAALERLVSRALIQQQIRREEQQAVEPSADEVQKRLIELRAQLPACVRLNCASKAGWDAFLAANRLNERDADSYMRLRLEMLAFIENRFRAGIRIPPEEIEDYYKKTLVPQYPKEQTPPSLDSVSPRIEEILLQEQVNKMFGAWLDNLRKQGDVEILDPGLEAAGVQPSVGGGGA